MRTLGLASEISIVSKLTARQRLLLGLLNALGGSAGNLDFQKVLFLYCQESASGQPYDFVPSADEERHHQRADETQMAGNQNSHKSLSL